MVLEVAFLNLATLPDFRIMGIYVHIKLIKNINDNHLAAQVQINLSKE